MSYVKIGVAGPVGSGKTALIEALSRKMAKDYSIGVITNDIYTKEDAQFLAKNSVLPVERIIGVETGGCPHTAIREDASMNLEAVDEMMERFPDIELLFIESGGDNLSATFSPELVDATIFVIDVAEGDKIPRKGGPGITRSDLLVINKIDLAPYVGASLEVMERDSRKMRGDRPFQFTNIRGDENVDKVVEWIKKKRTVRRNVKVWIINSEKFPVFRHVPQSGTAKPFWKIYPLPPRTRSWCPLRKKTTVFRSCPFVRLRELWQGIPRNFPIM